MTGTERHPCPPEAPCHGQLASDHLRDRYDGSAPHRETHLGLIKVSGHPTDEVERLGERTDGPRPSPSAAEGSPLHEVAESIQYVSPLAPLILRGYEMSRDGEPRPTNGRSTGGFTGVVDVPVSPGE